VHPGEGDEDLSESSKNPLAKRPGDKSRRTRKPDASGKARANDVGKALRSVYDITLREDVPSDFLDLLGKLR
jgi:hypothetical protein